MFRIARGGILTTLVVVMAAMKRSIVGSFTPIIRQRWAPLGLSSSSSTIFPRPSSTTSKCDEQRRNYRFHWSDRRTSMLSQNHRDAAASSAASSDNMNIDPIGGGENEFSNVNGDSTPKIGANETSTASSTEADNTNITSPSVDLTSFLAVDPRDVEFVTNENPIVSPKIDEMSQSEIFNHVPFVSMFRGSANYIANHRNTLAVYHVPGDVMDLPDSSVFRDLMNDVALTWLLGIKIVIVVGCRYQVDKRLEDRPKQFGLCVTDSDVLRVVKEEAGYVRFEVERQLARSLRLQGGAHSDDRGPKTGVYDGNVVSGNFYSAQPFGILDGVDFKYTGFVRRVEVEKIRQVHQSRDIVLLTTLGVSPSGEIFNVNSESLASAVAGALDASKIIFFTEQDVKLQHKVHGNQIQHLRVKDAMNLLDMYDVRIQKRGFVHWGDKAPKDVASRNMLLKIGWAKHAAEQGVKRAHIIAPTHGSLLQELYTRDGSGTLISGDIYDGIRQATIEDVNDIYDLIVPLVEMGTLVARPRDILERTISNYHVYTRDDLVLACGQLKLYDGGYAELGCLVVNPAYRARGRGDAMLGYLERLCLQQGASIVFVLSTQTMEWFIERGFDEVGVDQLPPSRPYNTKRASKIYMKKIDNVRDLDAAELWWNR